MKRNSVSTNGLSSSPHTDAPVVFEGLESRLLLAAAPTFAADLADTYILRPDGGGLTLGIDGADADGDALTVSIEAVGEATGLSWQIYDQQTSDNRYALLHFSAEDGTPMGDILVQLFEDRAPLATEQFITLATQYVDAEGNVLAPTAENPAFYTDVIVHRVIDDFVLQTGDAVNGDGTGGSPLGTFADQIDPILAYNAAGVLGTANSGADTNDSQWFITDGPTEYLTGGYTIFGQMISGLDVYETIMALETDGSDRPLTPPLLTSVDIIESDQDATITLVADETFTGPVDLTITLTDTGGATVTETITVAPDPTLGALDVYDILPGESMDIPLEVTYVGDMDDVTIASNVYFSGTGTPTAVVNAETHILHIEAPADYDGSVFYVEVAALVGDNQIPQGGNPFNYGYSSGSSWYAYATAGTIPAELPALDDVAADPGETIEIPLAVTYQGDHTITVSAASDYANGGVIDLAVAEPTAEGEPYTLTVALPAEYDGDAFTITVSATVDDSGVDAVTTGFQVAMAAPELGAIDDIPVVPGEQLTVALPITYAGGLPLDVAASTDYANGGQFTLGNPVEIDGEYVLTLDIPAEYDDGFFSITVTAAVSGYPGLDEATATFNVYANIAPIINDPGLLVVAPGQSHDELLLILNPDDNSDLTTTISTTADGPAVSIDPMLDMATITVPADFEGVFPVTVTAVETKYAGTDLAEPSSLTFMVSTADLAIGDLDDVVDAEPGETITREIPVYFSGDADLDVSVSSDYTNGGVLDLAGALAAPAGADAPYVLTLNIPADYDGESFTITVEAVDVPGEFGPVTKTFEVRFGSRPVLTQPDQVLATAGDATTVPITITDADGDVEFDWTVAADDPAVGIEINQDTGEVVFTSPADATHSFAVTVTALERGVGAAHPGVPAATTTFNVLATPALPTIDPIDTVSLEAGQTLDVPIPVDYDGDLALELTAASDYDNGGVLNLPAPVFQDGQWVLPLTTPAEYDGQPFSITISVGFADYATDTLATAEFDVYYGPTFQNELDDAYLITPDGGGVTIPIDGYDEDGDPLTITVDAGGADGLAWNIADQATSDNRYAVLTFHNADGSYLGEIVVQLFEDRAPLATERFITLSENFIDDDGSIIPADAEHDAFYTDTLVHRVIDGFMLQCGDAENGDGAGGSPLGAFADQFDPILAFTGSGVLAMANSGADTNDSQWFITDEITPWLDGAHTIFGQVVSGDDVREAIMAVETGPSDAPVNPPVLAGVEIVDRPQSGVITFSADENFTAAADVTITLTDAEGNSSHQTITLAPPPALGELDDVDAVPGETVEIPLPVTFTGDQPLTFITDFIYSGPGEIETSVVEVDGAYILQVTLPDDYDGSELNVGVAAISEAWTNQVPSNQVDEAVAFGFDYAADWVTQVALTMQTPTLAALDDLTVEPGEAVTVELPVVYAGDHALTVTAETGDGAPDVTLTISEPAVAGEPYLLSFTVPADYDGTPFDVAVSAALADAPDVAAAQSFTVAMAAPQITIDEMLGVIPGEQATIEFTVDYDGTHPMTVSVANDYDDGGVLAVAEPVGDGNAYTLTIDVPAEYAQNGEDGFFTLTVTAALDDYAVAADSQTVIVSLDSRPTITNPGLILIEPGAQHSELLLIIDPDDPAATDFDITISTDQAGAEVSISDDNGFALITAPDDFLGVFAVTITAVETKYADNPQATPTSETFYVSTLGDQPAVEAIDDVLFDPGATTDVEFTVDYDGDPADLAVSLSHDYAGEGEIVLTCDVPAAAGEPHVLHVALPAEYDHTPFDVTVGVTLVGYEDVVTDRETTFQVALNARPEITDPGLITVDVDASVNIPLDITDADSPDAELTTTVETDLVGAAVEINDADVVRITPPAGFTGAFEITVTSIETALLGNPDAAPATRTLTVMVGEAPVIGDVESVGDAAPGSEITVHLPVVFAGDQALVVTASSNYANGGELDLSAAVAPPAGADNIYTLTFTMPADYNGELFTVTVAAVIDGYADAIEATTTEFQVAFGARPMIENPGQQIVAPGVETQIPLTITDDQGADLDLTVFADDLDVLIDIDSATGVITLTAPADQTASFDIIVTAIETDLAAAHPSLTPTMVTFSVLSTADGLVVADIDDLDLQPGGTADVVIDVAYDGELDLVLTATSDYDNGGEFTLADPVLEDGQWVLHLALPTEYDGQAFDITVAADFADYPLETPAEAAFAVSYGVRPTIADPGVTVAPGETTTVALNITDDEATEFFVWAKCDDPDVVLSVDPDTYELSITAPEDYDEAFTITVSAIERNLGQAFPDLAPTAEEFTVNILALQGLGYRDLTPGADTNVDLDVVATGENVLISYEAAVSGYTGPGEVTATVAPPADANSPATLTIHVSDNYDGSAFTVTVSATVGDTTSTTTFNASAGARPTVVNPGPQHTADIVLDITDSNADAFVGEAVITSADVPDGASVSFDNNTNTVHVDTPDGFAGSFDITVTVWEAGWDGFDNIPGAETTFTYFAGVGFAADLADKYILESDGYGLTFGVDAWAADGAEVDISVHSSSKQLKTSVSSGNPMAHLVFADENGDEIGTIVIELFTDRSPNAVARFEELAAYMVQRTGWDLDADAGTYELIDPDATADETDAPYYSDVDVHLLIDGVLLQMGDALNGDGTGWSGLPAIGTDEGDGHTAYKTGNLGFSAPGAVAFGAPLADESSESQFFITEQAFPYFNEDYAVFGQVISGWDVYEELMNRPVDDNYYPESVPVLKSVEIVEDNVQDGSITLVGTKKFKGSAEVTVTLTDKVTGQTAEQTVTVTAAAKIDDAPVIGGVAEVELAAGETVDIPGVAYYNSSMSYWPEFSATVDYDGAGRIIATVVDDNAFDSDYILRLDMPDGYNGESFTVTVEGDLHLADSGVVLGLPPSTATYVFNGASQYSMFAVNETYMPEFDAIGDLTVELTPGESSEFTFAVQYDGDEPLEFWTSHTYDGDGDISVDVEPADAEGTYVLRVAADADYDGSLFAVSVNVRQGGYENLWTTSLTLATMFNHRPTISDPGLITLDPGTTETVELTITDPDVEGELTVDDFVVTASGEYWVDGQPVSGGVGPIVAVQDEETGEITYEVDVNAPFDFQGVIKVTVTAVEAEYTAAYANLAPAERIFYVSTLGERPEISADGETIYVDSGQTLTLPGLTFDNDDDLDLTYTIEASTPMVLAQLAAAPAEGFGAGGEFTLTLPEGFFGVFEVTVTAVEDTPNADEAFTAASQTFTVVATPAGAVEGDDVTVEERFAISGLTTAVVRDGDLLYVGLGGSGLKIYDVSDPTALVETGGFDYYDGFRGEVNTIEIIHLVVDNVPHTYALIAAGSGGLFRLNISDDGAVIGQTVQDDFVANDVAVRGESAFVAAGAGSPAGLVSVDISDPDELTILDTFTAFSPSTKTWRKYQNYPQHKALWSFVFSNAVSVEIHGHYAYVAEQYGEFVVSGLGQLVKAPHKGWVGVIDIINPNKLARQSQIKIDEYIVDSDLEGSNLYILGETSLTVVAINGGAAKKKGTITLDGSPQFVTVANQTALVTTDTGYVFIDASDPKHMAVVETFRVAVDTWSGQYGVTPVSLGGANIYLPLTSSGVVNLNAEALKPETVTVAGSQTVWVDGVPLKIKVKGGGQVILHFDGFDPKIDHLEIVGATANTTVTITGKKNMNVDIGLITVDGPLKSFTTKYTTLLGDFTAAGSVGKITLGDVGTPDERCEQTLTIGAAGAGDPTAVTIVMGSVYDLRINSAVAIKSLTALQWIDNETTWYDEQDNLFADPTDAITAPSIGNLTIKGLKKDSIDGDFEADLLLAGNGDTAATVLGKVSVKGDVSDSLWDVAGSVSVIDVKGRFSDSAVLAEGNIVKATFGALERASLFAGYSGDVVDILDLPVADDFYAETPAFSSTGSIAKLTVKGLKLNRKTWDESFVDTNIAAASLGQITLNYGLLDNGDDPFGLAARNVAKFVYRDGDGKRTWITGDLDNPLGLDDLIVRLV